MSNLLPEDEATCPSETPSCDAVELIIEPREKDLGGFSVRRVIPYMKRRMVGPWIFFDHAGPAEFKPGEGVDVRPHPHIGLATVTYLFDGELLHRDSLGSVQAIEQGAINLMVAGKGIVHSERTPPKLREKLHNLHALQLWLALPDEDEEIDPAFYHYEAETIPAKIEKGNAIRILMGTAHGLTSPVKTFSETLYVEYHLKAGATFTLPEAPERGLYIVTGGLKARDTVLKPRTMTIFDATEGIALTATEETHAVLIGGEPVGERVIDWNFVASSKGRLAQAREDWKSGAFDPVPGETEFIPLPD